MGKGASWRAWVRAGEKSDLFSIVLGRTSRRPLVIGLTREHSLARTHAGEPSGDVILEQTQPDPPPGCYLLVA
jgi:hypothetical protein